MPQKRNPPARKPEGNPIETTTTSPHHGADGQIQSTAVPGHRRWAEIVRRSTQLDCGCRDLCHCTPAPLSDNQITAWADCARFILDTAGVTPVVPLEVLRALWKRGGQDRLLAEKLREAVRR